jgi:DNA-binding NarL/FixJ family response regulator
MVAKLTEQTLSFGINVLDEHLSGLGSGGLVALVGGPGTGKTVAALHFLDEGVRQGHRVAHLTQARPEDVVAQANSIGIDISAHLKSADWLLLGYQPGFRQRYRRTIDPAEVFSELESLVGSGNRPERIVLDTCGPLVEGRDASNGAELLVELLGRLGGTSFLTFSAEYLTALDGGFDVISQRASLVLHTTLSSSGRRQFVVRKTLGPHDVTGPITFDIRDRLGIVPFANSRRERATEAKANARRRVLLLDATGELPNELRLWFEQSFELFATTDPVDAFPELARREFGLVVLNVDRRSVKRGLHVMHQLRRAAIRPPILVTCGYDLRASDRARALRSGADDFVSGGLNPDELASRIEALLRRGRSTAAAAAESDEPPRQPSPDEDVEVRAVMDIVRAHLEVAKPPIFSLVLLRPSNGKKVAALAKHVGGNMRRGSGDRMTVVDDRVEVYLDGALASHAEIFLNRVRSEGWKRTGSVVYTSPTDREELQKLFEE